MAHRRARGPRGSQFQDFGSVCSTSGCSIQKTAKHDMSARTPPHHFKMINSSIYNFRTNGHAVRFGFGEVRSPCFFWPLMLISTPVTPSWRRYGWRGRTNVGTFRQQSATDDTSGMMLFTNLRTMISFSQRCKAARQLKAVRMLLVAGIAKVTAWQWR